MERSPFCPYSEKIRLLYFDVFTKVLRKLFLQEMKKQNINNFEEFLNNYREDLFHLRGKHCCCGSNKQRNSILSNSLWNNLFNIHACTTSIQCPNKSHKSDCFHKYKANQWLTVENDVDFSLVCILLRNTCDTEFKTTIETVQSNRNEVIHTGKARIIRDEFELLWGKAMKFLSDVAPFVSKELEEQAAKEASDIYDYNEKLARYIEETLCEIKEHEMDNTFSPIRVLELVVNTLEEKGIAVVVGYPGSGKSFIGMEVIRIMNSKGKTVLHFDNVEIWDELINPKEEYVVFIDDFLGAFNTTETDITKLIKYFKKMAVCAKHASTSIILSVRKSIYERWHEQLEERSELFNRDVIIDLTEDDHHLSLEEKKCMLERHLQKNKIEILKTKKESAESGCLSIDQFTVNDISQKTAYNFPLLCFLFTTNENRMRLGEKFFEQPRNTLIRTIDGLRRSKDVKENWMHAILSYCAILGARDKFNSDKLDRDIFTSICHSLRLPTSDGQLELNASDAVDDLKDEYLKELERNSYEFIHQSFLEASILSYGKVCPDLVVQHCSKDILFDLIRTDRYQERKDEFVLKISEKSFEMLVNRFIAEINSNQNSIPEVLFHPVMEDKEFESMFLSVLQCVITAKGMPSEIIHSLLIEASRLGHINGVKTCLASHIPKHVLEEALNQASYNNRAEVVVLLARGSGVKLDAYFLQACSFGCEKVVCAMVNNKLILDNDLIEEGIFRSAKADHTNISLILIKVYKSVVTNAEKFRRTMFRIMSDAIDAEKGKTARELIFKENLCFEDEDIEKLVLESCYSNQMELAMDLVCEYIHHCQSWTSNRQSFVRRLLGGNRPCIDMVFEMKDLFHLRNFFNKDNINFILTSTGSGSYVVEQAYAHFPENVGSVCSSPDLVTHLLWIGCHSLVSQLFQANAELIETLCKYVRVAEKYDFVDFAVYCGYPGDLERILGELRHDRESLLYLSVRGYLNRGRIFEHEEQFGYRNVYYACNFFDTNSRQEGYLKCIENLYAKICRGIDKNSQILKTMTSILYNHLGSNTVDFVGGKTVKVNKLLTALLAKTKVLELFRCILLQSLDLTEILEIIDSINKPSRLDSNVDIVD